MVAVASPARSPASSGLICDLDASLEVLFAFLEDLVVEKLCSWGPSFEVVSLLII